MKQKEVFRTDRGYSLQERGKGLTPAMEDYVEMIYRLTAGMDYLRLKDLGTNLNVKLPSASKMLNRLRAGDYVYYEKHGLIKLTAKGKALGYQLYQRHNVLQSFLGLIGVRDNVLKDTERIEHVVSHEFLKRVFAFNSHAKDNPLWLAEFLSRYPPLSQNPNKP